MLMNSTALKIVVSIGCIGLFSSSFKKVSEYPPTEKNETRPNIIILYVDDLGYGDVGCYGAKGVQTPNVDALASKGVRFTDAHSPASTCTPSRFSLLTGRYAFRNNAAILPGDAPLLIAPGSRTLPAMLKQAGYKTGVIGKWHLGLGNGNIDWNNDVKPGPLEIGFDYSFILPATGDRVPCVYLENHRVKNLSGKDNRIVVDYNKKLAGLRNGVDDPQKLRVKADLQHSNTIVNGVSRIGFMQGGESALWVDEDFPDMFVHKATEFINDANGNPFFLYFSFHDIHVPRLPNKKFIGKSTMGPRGDAIAEMDWITGQITDLLKNLKIENNTLVIFTSDNGPVLNDGYEDQAAELLGDHKPGGPFRGGKYSAYEAGTRVPMIAYWPGRISKGTSDAVISQVDIYASLANLVGQKLAANEAIDSENMLPVVLGESKTGREYLIEESYTTSIRNGQWKYIEPIAPEKKLPSFLHNKGIEGGFQFFPQLFNLKDDLYEQKNLASKYPDVVEKFQKEISRIRKLE